MQKTDIAQSVLITGANRGMGIGYVMHYLKKGVSVLATAKHPKKAVELKELQKEYGKQLSILELDVTNEASITSFTTQLKRLEPTISIVINNAGISVEEEFGQWTMAMFETHFRVNTIGPALVSQAVLPFMEDGAKLVQVSSGMGSLQWNINPNNSLDAYAASKCALHSITVRLAEKLRDKQITVVAVNPGWVRTSMGGPEATSSISEAVKNMVQTIAQLCLKDTGNFLSETGETIPW